MSQKFDHPSCKVLVTGTTGTGKTTLLWRLVREQRAQWKYVFDHQGEIAGRFKLHRITNCSDLEEKNLRKGWVCYDPIEDFQGRTADAFTFFCEYVFASCKLVNGRKLFIVDELQNLIDTRTNHVPFLTIYETGRRYQVDVFIISQAPNRIHNAVRNPLTEVYTFRHTDDAAIKYLTENGFDADAVRNLKQYEYLHRDMRTGQITAGRETV